MICVVLEPFYIVLLTCSDQLFLQNMGSDISVVYLLEFVGGGGSICGYTYCKE